MQKSHKKQSTSKPHGQDDWLAFSHNQSEKLDAFIRFCTAAKPDLAGAACLVAVGGYGRREMAPWSDVDLLVLHESPLPAAAKKQLAGIAAWDWPQGLHLSLLVHDAESLAALLAQDVPALTSMLDGRLVAGDAALYARFKASVAAAAARHGTDNLVAAKLAEQDARHAAMGDSRYDLQPNVKEGKGGLRDLHTLRWLGQLLLGDGSPAAMIEAGIYSRDEARRLADAQHFFAAVRYHLHRLHGRRQDRLVFESQPQVAAAMGYQHPNPNTRAESFMRDYFRMAQETGHLTRILCAVIEQRALAPHAATAGQRKPALATRQIDGFAVDNNRLNAAKNSFRKTPSEVLRLFRVSQREDIDIHPDALRQMRAALPALQKQLPQDRAAYALFREILCDGRRCAQTLRRMNEAGVLVALLPAFANIHAHMQYDMYHTVTADEHTIRACGYLHDIASGRLTDKAPVASATYPTLAAPHILHLAMFLHDIAKGTGDNHDLAGAAIARDIAPLFGLDDAETDNLCWLVENHLLLSMTALKRDIDDNETIEALAAAVQSPERLKMLICLTVADIMAVGPDVWNSWKAGLIRQLYHRTYDALTGIAATPAEIAPYLDGIDSASETTQIAFAANMAGDISRLVVYTADAPGVFSTLSGGIAAAGASIVQARIFTLPSGMILDVFDLQDARGRAYENEKFLAKTLKRALDGRLDIAGELDLRRRQQPRRQRPARLPARVIIDNTASRLHTLVEINAPDRPGLLYDITARLSDLGLNIHAAKVATFGRQAVDVFYVKDAFGLKILHPERLASLEKDLMMGLEIRPPADL